MKDATSKIVQLAPESDGTEAISATAETADRSVGDSSVALASLQADPPDGIEDGSPDGKTTVRIMSMTLTRFPCGACGGQPGGDQTPEYGNPILTMAEAARMIGVSRKRLANLIAAEKGRLGRLPDFMCDAGGKMPRRVLRDELLEWAKGKAKKRGRPPKQTPQ